MSQSNSELTHRVQHQEQQPQPVIIPIKTMDKQKKKDWGYSNSEITKILEYLKSKQLLAIFFSFITISVLCVMIRIKFPDIFSNNHIEAYALLGFISLIIFNILILLCLWKISPINFFLVDVLLYMCWFSVGTSFGLHLIQFFRH